MSNRPDPARVKMQAALVARYGGGKVFSLDEAFLALGIRKDRDGQRRVRNVLQGMLRAKQIERISVGIYRLA